MKERIVIASSGGIDSTTVIGWAVEQDFDPILVRFKYGSKHNRYELQAAKKVQEWYEKKLGRRIASFDFDLFDIFKNFPSALLVTDDRDIPEGYYTDQTMEQTVVPSRNIIFLSIMSGLAWSVEAPYIALGIHKGDHAIYPDCRVTFFDAMDRAIREGTDGRVSFLAPFVLFDKAGIIRWGLDNGVPYHLTRTCYKNQPLPCGKCGSCQERIDAFRKNGIEDPVMYEGEEVTQ